MCLLVWEIPLPHIQDTLEGNGFLFYLSLERTGEAQPSCWALLEMGQAPSVLTCVHLSHRAFSSSQITPADAQFSSPLMQFICLSMNRGFVSLQGRGFGNYLSRLGLLGRDLGFQETLGELFSKVVRLFLAEGRAIPTPQAPPPPSPSQGAFQSTTNKIFWFNIEQDESYTKWQNKGSFNRSAGQGGERE